MNSDFTALSKIHEEFTRNNYFTVFSLMTPKLDWLWIDINNRNYDEKVKEAKKKEFFNLVVKDNESTLGYINLEDLNDDINKKLEKVNEHIIPSSMPLYDLTAKMIKDAKNLERERSPLYFVTSPGADSRDPIGLVTLWDLNRAPSYIFSYSILVYLEQTLLFKIKDSHKSWENHDSVINKIKATYPKLRYIEDLDKFIRGPQYKHKALSKLGLPELLAFYMNDPHIVDMKEKIIDDLVNHFKSSEGIRNRIGHPINLLVRDDDDNFLKDLSILNRIWDVGREAFIKFLDPKVRHSSPYIEE